MKPGKSLLLATNILLLWLFAICTRGDFVSTLISFNGTNGGAPNGLLLGVDGNFYGTTSSGGTTTNLGTVFQMATNGVFTTLASFNGTNGNTPYGGLAQGADGNFYGTTYIGGASNLGTVFQITTNGTLATLASFRITNGSRPYAALVPGTNGNFYGTTSFGGANNAGTVFKINPTNGTLSVLHSLTGGNGGANPYAGLVLGTNGNFYGTTYGGGTNSLGTVFMISPDAVTFKSWSFTLSKGANPEAGLVLGTNGILYGTTSAGGSSGYGTVFMITHDFATSSALHSFTRVGDDGAIPLASLVQNYDGDFYGSTLLGGKYDYGMIFRFRVSTNPIPSFTNVYSFAGGIDGGNPQAQNPLTADGLWNIFGTASSGGAGQGTLFLLIHPPEFKSSGRTGGLFAADWSAQLGWAIKYQYRYSLDLTHWTNSGTAFSATNHSMTTSSPIGTTSRWFLDIQELPPGIGLW